MTRLGRVTAARAGAGTVSGVGWAIDGRGRPACGASRCGVASAAVYVAGLVAVV